MWIGCRFDHGFIYFRFYDTFKSLNVCISFTYKFYDIGQVASGEHNKIHHSWRFKRNTLLSIQTHPCTRAYWVSFPEETANFAIGIDIFFKKTPSFHLLSIIRIFQIQQPLLGCSTCAITETMKLILIFCGFLKNSHYLF